MQIDTELGLISWFVEQQYIGSAIIENKSAQKWFATIYFCNTSQTVIFY